MPGKDDGLGVRLRSLRQSAWSDHHRYRLRALRRLRGRAGAGGACLLCPVPGSGAAAPIREVLEGSDRLPGRRASGAKVPLVLRASPGLDGWSAGQDPGYRRAGPPPAGLGGAGAPDLPEPPRYFDSDRCRRRRSSCLASLERRWRPCWRIRSWRSRSGRRPSNGRSSPSPSSITWDLPTATPWPRTCWSTSRPESPTGSTSRPFMTRVAQWPGDVPTTCEHCSSPAWSAPSPRSSPRPSSSSWTSTTDEGVTRLLATSFTSVLRRPLTFHLAQAGLSFQCFREIARLLRERRWSEAQPR